MNKYKGVILYFIMLPYIFVFSLLILVFLLLLNFKSSKEIPTRVKDDLTGKPCPICHWPLRKNERVHSHLFKSSSDAIMHIYGCPYCYIDHPKSRYRSDSIRICPACNKRMDKREFLIARLFEKPGKNHVHVLGCHRCRGRR